ncbi:hypothetical protein STCU_11890 [Strigomonas culicis]|uniref:Uncharacterized protein n=1 Tax=Strigomonas culicis TaxID=28005 RepID=S9UYM8_9TRYP|nr:hypothetical protein STCU_11890 [Strigomonas culicis]|eukprot:EPY15610.1 hypothetical protein STCU_11890 [Strigomonas culicis]
MPQNAFTPSDAKPIEENEAGTTTNPTYEFNFADAIDAFTAPPPPQPDKKRSATGQLSFNVKRQGDYTADQWENRLRKVSKCSSIGELLRYFIGTEMLPTKTAMQPSELDAFVQERLLLTSSKVAPLWRCTFTLPVTEGNRYILSGDASDDRKDRYVTQTKAYPKKLKCKQIAFFRAAMTLYPDETAYYCTLNRSDCHLAQEAMESLFDFTNSADPLTCQVTAAFGEELNLKVKWALEQMFPSLDALLPDKYEVEVRYGTHVYRHVSDDSVVSAFVGAMLKAEEAKGYTNYMEAMWLEFVKLKPPVRSCGQDILLYLFNHFFGVKNGKESAHLLEDTQEGTTWRTTVKLHYSLAHPELSVTVATATGATKKAAQDAALRQAGARNFREVFVQIAQADPKKVNKVAIQYAKEIVDM